jgi:hypothetical protein
MTVCLRDGKEAVEQLKTIYPDEAKNATVELDIMAKLGDLALQHRGTGSSIEALAVAPALNASNGPDQSDTSRIVYLVRLISIWYCIANGSCFP